MEAGRGPSAATWCRHRFGHFSLIPVSAKKKTEVVKGGRPSSREEKKAGVVALVQNGGRCGNVICFQILISWSNTRRTSDRSKPKIRLAGRITLGREGKKMSKKKNFPENKSVAENGMGGWDDHSLLSGIQQGPQANPGSLPLHLCQRFCALAEGLFLFAY